jgi:hypothetical protein
MTPPLVKREAATKVTRRPVIMLAGRLPTLRQDSGHDIHRPEFIVPASADIEDWAKSTMG